jgi:carbon storage regulator
MLVLSRKPRQQIRIGDDTTLIVLEVRGNRVRIGIDAPRGVSIMRAELEGATVTSGERNSPSSRQQLQPAISR